MEDQRHTDHDDDDNSYYSEYDDSDDGSGSDFQSDGSGSSGGSVKLRNKNQRKEFLLDSRLQRGY